jgi:hypothetical protein
LALVESILYKRKQLTFDTVLSQAARQAGKVLQEELLKNNGFKLSELELATAAVSEGAAASATALAAPTAFLRVRLTQSNSDGF